MEISTHLRMRCCPVCGCNDESTVAYPARIDEQQLDSFAFASRKIPELMHLRLLRCPTCALLYASPALTPAFLSRAYSEAAYDSNVEADYAASTYARQLPRLVRELGRAGTALEVGSGNGAFLRHLVNAGFQEVIGIEPSTQAIAMADEAVRPLIRPGMFQPLDFQPGSISLFSCFQTIEHVENPRELCREAYRLLRPGGAIFLVGHDHASWVTSVFGEKSPIFDIEHLQLFSKDSLEYLLKACGFQDVRIGTLWNRYPIAYWIKLLPLSKQMKRIVMAAANRLWIGKLPISVNIGNMYAIAFRR